MNFSQICGKIFLDGECFNITKDRRKKMLNIGDRAPDFTLKDKNGKDVTLSDFKGKRVVLYFYPKDNTPGCTRQACAFAGLYGEFKKKNVPLNKL